ncbi:MAG: hypothetical protein ABWX84_16545 [Nocardioides sp.]
MNGTTPDTSPSSGSAEPGSVLWDDYGYHHDGLVESISLVPVPRSGHRNGHGCRGQEGREHTPVIRWAPHFAGSDMACPEVPTWWGFCFHEEACASCGVVLRRCVAREECPDISLA